MSKPEDIAVESYSADEVFNTAMSYLTAYRYMHGMIQPLANPALSVASAMPIMSMCALVIELQLKVLHVLDHGKVPRGHDLANLYRNLSMSSRIAINKWWKADLPRHRKIHEQIEAQVGGTVKTELIDALESGRRGFEKFRYSFEQGADANDDFMLSQLPEIILKVMVARRPEWSQWVPRPPKWLQGAPV